MAEEKKTPKRLPVEIANDIAAEREGLASAFDSLSSELQQAADTAAEKARTAGRKALVVVPAVAVSVGALVGAASLLRRWRRRDR
jgi:hypothetical protein